MDKGLEQRGEQNLSGEIIGRRYRKRSSKSTSKAGFSNMAEKENPINTSVECDGSGKALNSSSVSEPIVVNAGECNNSSEGLNGLNGSLSGNQGMSSSCYQLKSNQSTIDEMFSKTHETSREAATWDGISSKGANCKK